MVDYAQIFNIQAPISLKQQKLETSNLMCAPMTMSSFDGMQNTRSNKMWPSLGNLDFKFTEPCNYLSMAMGFKFSTQIDCRWIRQYKSRSKGVMI